MSHSVTIRPAVSADIPLILSFIQKKAEFDRQTGAFTGVLQTTEQRLQETLFGAMPYAFVLLAEVDQTVGFALYYFRYSSFIAQPSIWLDDLFIDPSYRQQGIGTALMRQLAKIAIERSCTHLAWTASSHNVNGVRFYHKLGAQIVDQQESRLYFQLNTENIRYLSITGSLLG